MSILKSGNRYLLSCKTMSYGFEVTQNSAVNLYWGSPLSTPDDLPGIPLRQNYRHCPGPVSYTHLTLPTIYSV